VKPLVWLGLSLDEVRSFPPEARRESGYQLYKVQVGLEPSDWKTLPTIGPGVREIRIHTGNEYRVIYVAKFREAVYVLHAFAKKTAKTTRANITLARQRLQGLEQGGSRL
jgi:phage-related protein